VISHLDATIETLLRQEVPLTEQECHIGFEIPDDVWETKIKTLPDGQFALNIYLYDVRENRKLRFLALGRSSENYTVNEKFAQAGY
jgi:hypothetical protein